MNGANDAFNSDNEDWSSEGPGIFDAAIFSIFMWLVPHVSIVFGDFRGTLVRSSFWNSSTTRFLVALQTVQKATLMACFVSLVVISGLACLISLLTRGLDNRMGLILMGLSSIFSSAVIVTISLESPKWVGIYYSTPHSYEKECGKSLKELWFNVYWGISQKFVSVGFLLLPFFCGVQAATIPFSALAGIAAGFFVDIGVYLSRRQKSNCLRNVICAIMVLLISVISSFLFAVGVLYIDEVWGYGNNKDDKNQDVIVGSSFIFMCIVILVYHIFLRCGTWCIYRRLAKDIEFDEQQYTKDGDIQERPKEESSGQDGKRVAVWLASSQKARMATSMFFERGSTLLNEVEKRREKMKGGNFNEAIAAIIQEDEDDEEDTKEGAGEKEGIVESSPDFEDIDVGEGPVTKDVSDTKEGSLKASQDLEEEPFSEPPSTCFLIRQKMMCCYCIRDKEGMGIFQKIRVIFEWTVWVILVMGSLYLVIVNIGASVEGNDVRRLLPAVNKAIYLSMDEGPVCAFDNRGADSNITTFPNKEAAHAVGFEIVHCGACAACSDWNNLQQEYSTRKFLAKESARCARKSLTGGADAVNQCLEMAPIEFEGRCAECWTEDILCTKAHCTFIFLQSTVINTVGNFAVGPDTVTSAACEEAWCEAGPAGDFVYCSGATRRRMNITSSIQRPGAQRCSIVDVDWAVVFPGM